MSEDEMSNKTDATFHPGTAPVYPVVPISPPVVAGPPGQDEKLAETRADHPLAPDYDWAHRQTGSVPVWADLAAQHGWNTGRHENRGDGRPWTSPEAPPWAGRRDWAPRWILPATLAALALTVLALTGLLVQRMNWLPASFPIIGKDTGYAACEAIHAGRAPVEAKGIMTLDQYRQAREVFADSRYAGIRDNGIKLMDLAWQAQGMGDNNLGVLALMGGVADAYSGLAGGCASVGITIPALGEG